MRKRIDQICRAQRYERSAERLDTQAGQYERIKVDDQVVRHCSLYPMFFFN